MKHAGVVTTLYDLAIVAERFGCRMSWRSQSGPLLADCPWEVATGFEVTITKDDHVRRVRDAARFVERLDDHAASGGESTRFEFCAAMTRLVMAEVVR